MSADLAPGPPGNGSGRGPDPARNPANRGSDRGTGGVPFVPASHGGERRVRALVTVTRRLATFALRYRLRELQLLVIPCAIVLVTVASLSPEPALRGALPVGLMAAGFTLMVVLCNALLTWVAPWADQHLWPVAALLLALDLALTFARQPALVPTVLAAMLAGTAVLAGAAAASALLTRRLAVFGWAAPAPEDATASEATGTAGGTGRASIRRLVRRVAAARGAGAALLLATCVALAWGVAAWRGDAAYALVVPALLLVPYYCARGGGVVCLVTAACALAVALVATRSGSGEPALLAAATTAPIRAVDETLGFPGIGALIALAATLTSRSVRVALQQRGSGAGLLAVALAAAFAAQAVAALGAYGGFLPPTEIGLPFLPPDRRQYGLHFLALGALLRLSSDAGAPARTGEDTV